MDLEAIARGHALELLVTQLIAEQLRSVPEPYEQVRHARERLALAAERINFETVSLDEEVRLRVQVQATLASILDAALQRAVVVPIHEARHTVPA